MKIKSLLAGLLTAGFVVAFSLPAAAQSGGVVGKVLDDQDKPAADVTIVLDNPNGLPTVTMKTNAKGEYQMIGIRIGEYRVTATKGDQGDRFDKIRVGIGNPTELPPLQLRKVPTSGASPAAAAAAAAAAADSDKAKKLTAELQVAAKAAQAAADAGNFDDAIAQYTKLSAQIPKCSPCYLEIGRLQIKKKSNDAAEAAFKQSIDADPTKADAYSELADLYNSEKKFDDATKMSAKANELMSASGNADPVAVLNQGVMLWNGSKPTEAQAQFEKAVQLDPKLADAHYFLGLALVNQNKLPEAKKEFETYMTLSPTGSHADDVKGLLTALK